MEINENIENIRDFILTNKKPSYQTTNKKEVSVRCPYCGDSKSNLSATHFYIEMKPPFRFHCFKCESSGVLNNSVLRDLQIFDSNVSISIINTNKTIKENSKTSQIKIRKRNLLNEAYNSEISFNSVRYFNQRYNTNLDESYIVEKFKCVTDAPQFFSKNNIYIRNQNYDFANSIGFISSDSSHIVFRDTSGRQERRYNNLNLDPNNFEEGSKIYNISTNIDTLKPKLNLVITEGIFDIIGVYLNFYKDKNEENTVFAAACGKSFISVILKYLRLGFLDLDITIFSDADVNISFYKNLKQTSSYLKNQPITIYYNNLYDPKTGYGKDFGVPINQIQLKKIII